MRDCTHLLRRRLRPWRERLGLSQAKLAAATGFSSAYIGAIENDGDASTSAIHRVAATLAGIEAGLATVGYGDVDVAHLIGLVDELERQLGAIEEAVANEAATRMTAGAVMSDGHANGHANGHGQPELPLFSA